ncbi:jg22289, partial [Pararge aegeria aegeria]
MLGFQAAGMEVPH